MKEDVFITYANNPLKGNPENLHKIFAEIKKNAEIDINGAEEAIKLICELATYNDPDIALKLRPQRVNQYYDHQEYRNITSFDFAADAVYGYRNGYCERGCYLKEFAREILPIEYFEIPNRITCCECAQLCFIDTIEKIINGEELSEIEAFKFIISLPDKYLQTESEVKIVKTPQESPYREILKRETSFSGNFSDAIQIDKDDCDSHSTFNFYLLAVNAECLIDFLINDARGKLKRCQFCNKIFVASKNAKNFKYCKICSRKNRMTKEQRNEFMRQRRAKEKNEKKTKKKEEKELKIQSHMESLGISRDKAEKLWEDDQKV